MCLRLLAAGYAVTAFDLDRDALGKVIAAGAAAAS